MKSLKYLGVATLLATGFATAAHAADVVDFAAAGSSAQYSIFTSAFLNQGYTSHYSHKSSSNFQIADASTTGIPNENAQVAIYWHGAVGNYRIAVFYQVDSSVGVRAFFNNATLTATGTPPAPGNIGQPGSGDVVPPAEVLTTIAGTAVGVGATDITPEDARVATECSINLGYSKTNAIKSGVVGSTAVASPVRFSLTNKLFTLRALGAVPIVVFINGGPTFSAIGSGNNGAPSGNNLNVDSFTLASLLRGQFSRTSDLILVAGAA